MKLTLKAIRANENLTQEEAGEKVGVSKYTWRNWEVGKTFPTVAQLKEIEKRFEVSYSDIIFLDDDTV